MTLNFVVIVERLRFHQQYHVLFAKKLGLGLPAVIIGISDNFEEALEAARVAFPGHRIHCNITPRQG